MKWTDCCRRTTATWPSTIFNSLNNSSLKSAACSRKTMSSWWARPIIRKTSIPACFAAADSQRKFGLSLPGTEQRAQLISLYLKGIRLESGLTVSDLADRLSGSAPADLQAICTTAKRMAFNRLTTGSQLPPLSWADFEKAIERVHGGMVPLDGTAPR